MSLSVARSSGKCSAAIGGGTAVRSARLMPIRRMGYRKCSTEYKKRERPLPLPRRCPSAPLASTRRRPVIAPRPPGVLPIDAVEQHGQLRRAQRHAGLARRRGRPAKGPPFQPLVHDDEAVLVPVQQLDAVAAFVAK